MKIIVTTIQKPPELIIEEAIYFAKELNTTYISRDNYSLQKLQANFDSVNIVVVTKNGPVIHTSNGLHFFHLNMAELRIKNIKNGKHDHMTTAMDLKPGSSVLDCTLGLGTDAIVASFITGEAGKIIGLESSLLLHFIVQQGLKNYKVDDKQIEDAMHRIETINSDYYSYLLKMPAKSVDVVYFDPMFRRPICESSNMNPLRTLANHASITLEAINEAKRVAKKRVVIKEQQGSKEFIRLGIDELVGGKYSSIQYGIIKVNNSYE